MATKTKINQTAEVINDVATNAGIVLMSAAVTLGMVEMPHHPDKRAVLPVQPHFAPALATGGNEGGTNPNELRRERDEIHPHYHGFSANQRTPGRSGKI